MLWHFIHDFLLPLLSCPFVWGMLWSPCCCGASCTFFSDDFSVDDLATNYTSVSGSWSIGSGVLSTSSSTAILTGSTANPNGDSNTNVTVTVNIATSGDTARIILDYQNSSNYWYAEFKSGTGAYLKIFQRSGGADYEMVNCTGITGHGTGTYRFCASIYNGTFRAEIDGSPRYSIDFSSTFSQTGWGLGTGTLTGTVTFDNLVAAITSADCSPCANPGCPSVSIGPDCTNCSGTGTTPLNITCHIPAGTFSNSGCSFCTDVNNTDVACSEFGHGCEWAYPIVGTDDIGCGSLGFSVDIQLNKIGSNYKIQIAIAFGTSGATAIHWEKDLGTSKPDCMAFSSLEIPFKDDTNSDCNASTSVYITSGP